MTLDTWVVGRRGLLGSALAEVANGRRLRAVDAPPLPWQADAAEFAAAVDRSLALLRPDAWALAWCAGASVTGASPESVERELSQLRLFLDRVAAWTADSGPRVLFYASSAGGVYAGSARSARPPFTEATPTAPLSPYGQGKLAAESMIRDFAAATGARALLGRIANLYGPAQSLQKGQGLITHLARAQLSTTPVSIYVPLETTRDYIYSSDAALLIRDCLLRLLDDGRDGEAVTKIIATHQAASIAALLGHFSVLSKAHPHVMLGSSPSAAYQAVDLRLESQVWRDLDRRPMRSLAEGIGQVLQQMMFAVQAGERP